MKTISQNQLLEIIRDSKGALIVGLLTLTDAKARKTNNPFGQIFKQVRSVGFVGADYQKAVERESGRQLTNSNDFQSESLPWGEWLILNKVIIHKGEFYLRTQTTPNQRRKQAAKVLNYRDAGGKFLSFESIKNFLPPVYESAKQQDEAGLDKTVWVRTYKFSSIQKIRINGQTFLLEHPEKTTEIKNKLKSVNNKITKTIEKQNNFK